LRSDRRKRHERHLSDSLDFRRRRRHHSGDYGLRERLNLKRIGKTPLAASEASGGARFIKRRWSYNSVGDGL
jgi:hypothetical protein